MTHEVPTLPPELIEHIMSFLSSDNALSDLRSCTLICSSWLFPSQSYLLSSIALFPSYPAPVLQNPVNQEGLLEKFQVLLDHSPHLANHVRHLVFACSGDHAATDDTVDRLTEESAERILSLLPLLSKLSHLSFLCLGAGTLWESFLHRVFGLVRGGRCALDSFYLFFRHEVHFSTASGIRHVFQFMRDTGLKSIALTSYGNGTEEHIDNDLPPSVLPHLRSLRISLTPLGLEHFQTWILDSATYIPEINELSFSFMDAVEVRRFHQLLAGTGLPPTLAVLSCNCEDFRWEVDDVNELEKPSLNSIHIAHLNLTADEENQRPSWRHTEITALLKWWIHLISGCLSHHRTSLTKLSLNLAFLSLEREPTVGIHILDAVNELDDFLSSAIARRITSISLVRRNGRPLPAPYMRVLFPKTLERRTHVFREY
ncbi:hypothetical protein BDZ89DRAFT_1073004 [Hymenopellis radicata]|nr:hypothetical protein BDZ89DRAFT_1073004 [Hymenopellis radicata]